ncbi:MAG: hypothetical protein ABR529_15770 [Actinomycetota bacterium]
MEADDLWARREPSVPQAPPPPPYRHRNWIQRHAYSTAAVAFVIGVAIGGAGSVEAPDEERTTASDPSTSLRANKLDARDRRLDNRATDLAAQETLLDERQEELDQQEKALAAEPEPEPEPEVAAPAGESFGEGTLIVGQNVAPGTYQASGSEACYWARLKGLGGGLDDIITNHIGGGTQTVAIAPTDVAFESAGCGTWSPV